MYKGKKGEETTGSAETAEPRDHEGDKPESGPQPDALPFADILAEYATLAADEGFRRAWRDWNAERKGHRKSITARAASLQLKKLAAVGPEAAIAAIEASIAGGWTGLFPEGKPSGGNHRSESGLVWQEREPTPEDLAVAFGPEAKP